MLRRLLALTEHEVGDLREWAAAFERDVHCLLAQCHHHGDGQPAAVTITARDKDGNMSDTYEPGQTIYLTAAAATDQQTPVPNAAGSWSSTQGTITQNPNNVDEATLVNVPVGDATVTFTAANGVAGTLDVSVVDNAVASVTVTSSATPPADEAAPASA